jgi:hypothetical protein
LEDCAIFRATPSKYGMLDFLFGPKDVASTFLWNVDKLVPYYMSSHSIFSEIITSS